MNEFWIINENENVTSRLRNELLEAGVAHHEGREVELAWIAKEMENMLVPGCVCFLAVKSIDQNLLRTISRFHEQGSAKVVVLLEAIESDVALNLFRAGASDVLTLTESFRSDFIKLLSRLHAASVGEGKVGKIVSVLSSNCYLESSLLAVNLAAAFAKTAGKCALVDLHLHGGDLATMLNMSPTHTLRDLLTQRMGLDDSMIDQVIAKHDCGIHLVASPPLYSNREEFDLNLCSRIVEYAMLSRPYTLVHCDRPAFGEQMRALVSSEAIFVPCRLDMASVVRTKGLIKYLSANGIKPDLIQVVAFFNECESELPPASVKKVLQVNELATVKLEPVNQTSSINLGEPLVLQNPGCRCAQGLLKISESVTGVSLDRQRKNSTAAKKSTSFLDRLGSVIRSSPSPAPR
ncbi:CpaE family protein [Rhodopirellula sp. MGV]|uniref:AAA family ATPase n=1 Tax=Rhodopirellula sp. MGV TaxID=2023130 RepID=UPI000B95FA4C|nr:hypothetical protein [Rhodopirellula sp. MGV]OYP33169.1 hypothetical protein CGZ80_18270 [Rhodopirellula sp. MGV]PNY35101.1 hypothetical protein C2E31_19540 [Rhodopirellula baltica]